MLSKLIAHLYNKRMQRLESAIGYRVTFSKIPVVWIDSWMTYGMERAWAKHGIKARGVNYFTFGALVDGVSSRFIRSEKQYQSWLGAYLVEFKEDKDFTLQDHFNLAVADQKNWLHDYGDMNPYIEMPRESATPPKNIIISGYPAKLYEYTGGPSHSGVGSRSNNWFTRIIIPIMAEMMNIKNPSLKLHFSNFMPKNISTDYETVILKGYIAIVELEQNMKVVLYGNSTQIKNKNGTKIDYFPELKQDILDAYNSVKIIKF